tara:strand:+ start:325 stop:432 length:108 start_codon:yes stop_codon:yes gene_type:complete
MGIIEDILTIVTMIAIPTIVGLLLYKAKKDQDKWD